MSKNYQRIVGTVLSIIFVYVLVEALTRYRVGGVLVYGPNKVFEQRHQITEDDLSEYKVSRHLLDESMIVEKEALVGRYVALNHTIYPGNAISMNSLEEESFVHDMPLLLLNDDQSLFSMKADNVASAGNTLSRGHYVDVSFVRSGYREDVVADVLLSNVRVVGVRDRKGVEVSESGEPVQVILLAIDSDKLGYLLKAQTEGSIVLSAKGVILEGLECELNESMVVYFES